MAIYSASKDALEGYFESLDHGLRTRGIRVVVIEPGVTKTPFDANLLEPDLKIDDYREVRAALHTRYLEVVAAGDLASEVARHPRATRHAFASHFAPTLDALATWLSSRQGKDIARADAAAFLGLLAGTLQFARATPDRAESNAILEAGVRAAVRLATERCPSVRVE